MDDRPASPAAASLSSLVVEPQAIPPPHPEVHLEQVIKGDQEPTARVAESDERVEQIDNPDGVLDCQE